MRVLIVEDDFIVADHLRLMLKKHGIEVIEIVDSVDKAIQFLEQKPDLVFVDIRLKGNKTGIDLAVELNKVNQPFIFLTANNEINTLKKAAQTSPLSYITKPYKESDILALIEIYKSSQTKTISVKTLFGKKTVELSSILYFEAEGAYVNVVTQDKVYKERKYLSELDGLFPETLIRVHRGYIINKDKISQYNSKYVYIQEHAIPISRTYKKELLMAIDN